jgi:peroxiredoxin
MAIESKMLPLGTKAPDFALPDTKTDAIMSLSDLASNKANLIMFICNHCPYVIHVNDELVQLANEYLKRGVALIAISSNDVINYPQDSPENMKTIAEKEGYPFPYLYDESQEVAKAYHATCTPDFFLFDGNMKLVYRGQMDDSRPSNGKPVTGRDLRNAIDIVLSGGVVPDEQMPSIGCGIKWK